MLSFLSSYVPSFFSNSSVGAPEAGVPARACSWCHNPFQRSVLCDRCNRIEYCGEDCRKGAEKTHQFFCDSHQLIPKDNEGVCRFWSVAGMRAMTQEEFRKETGCWFTHGPLYTREAREECASLTEEGHIPQSLPLEVSDAVALFKQPGLRGYGVRAVKPILRGTRICSFSGVVFTDSEWNAVPKSLKAHNTSTGSASLQIKIDPSEYASLGAFINDGPPNCMLQTLVQPTKFSDTDVTLSVDDSVIAIRDIKMGEQLFINYGYGHTIKSAPYEIDKASLKELAKRFPEGLDLSKFDQKAMGDFIVNEGSCSIDDHMSSVLWYIFSTPAVFLLLHLEQSFDPLETQRFLEKCLPRLLQSKQEVFDMARMLLKALGKIEKKQAFADIVRAISQKSLIQLCEFIGARCIPVEDDRTIRQLKLLGQMLDNAREGFCGSLHGTFWDTTEKEQFLKRLCTVEHLQKILKPEGLGDLPVAMALLFATTANSYINALCLQCPEVESTLRPLVEAIYQRKRTHQWITHEDHL